MGLTRMTLVRHGETEWNVTMQLQGHKDSSLTVLGKKQVEGTAELIKDRNFDNLFTSDLRRAAKTAEIINKYHNLEIKEDKGLRERNFGIMESLTRNQLKHRFPETYEGYMNRVPDYQIPNGESLNTFYIRVVETMNKIAAENEGKNNLIITHGGVLDCVIRYIFSLPLDSPRRYRLYNASVNSYVIQNNRWVMEEWGLIPPNKALKPKDELATLEVK